MQRKQEEKKQSKNKVVGLNNVAEESEDSFGSDVENLETGTIKPAASSSKTAAKGKESSSMKEENEALKKKVAELESKIKELEKKLAEKSQ